MLIHASNMPLSLDASLPGKERLRNSEIAQALGVRREAVVGARLLKRSVDARKKANVHFVATCEVELNEAFVRNVHDIAPLRGVNVSAPKAAPHLNVSDARAAYASAGEPRPVVVGTGPAGLFCALYLARAGLTPLVVERGACVEERAKAVEAFAAGGALDVLTNIQFGEGGAGTFSDGKLNTGTKSPHIRHVLEEFVAAGAPEEILWQAKPHIGTDKLVSVVRNLRQSIIAAGGEVRFNTLLEDIECECTGWAVERDVEQGARSDVEQVVWQDAGQSVEQGAQRGVDQAAARAVRRDAGQEFSRDPAQAIRSVVLRDLKTGSVERVAASRVVLACGHSARDTFEMVHGKGLLMERKPFAVGVRIEHPQKLINEAQYGKAANHPALGAADYKLAVHTKDGRGVYTFCMCPGGEVVAAASEEGGVCVNGMSRFARDGENANSALLVGIEPTDFPGDDVLAGVAFQREIERAAYRLGVCRDGLPEFVSAGSCEGSACAASACSSEHTPYVAPAQTVGDFLSGTSGNPSKLVRPTYPCGVAWRDLHECLPRFVTDAMEEALPLLDRKLAGFAHPQAVMTGVEARSSSPVRIVRDETLQAQVALAGACAVTSGVAAVAAPGNDGEAACVSANAVTQVSTEAGQRSVAERDACADGIGYASLRGLYPCGEGAGYAGGITSAAVDGLRIAEAIVAEFLDKLEGV